VQREREAGTENPELVQFRWMMEELRVSLFAQELGTSLAVSSQRLDKQWVKVQQHAGRENLASIQ
jgi:ATP-dependent helicase HrpA